MLLTSAMGVAVSGCNTKPVLSLYLVTYGNYSSGDYFSTHRQYCNTVNLERRLLDKILYVVDGNIL
jgi:hypothetical protein